MADLNAATVDDVAAFFKTYYAPNNAVLSIVGDVDTKVDAREGAEVLRVDSVAAGAAGRRHDRAAADRGAAHDDRGRAGAAAAPRHGLQDPAELVADDDALQVLGTVLSSGRQLALLRDIVRQKQLAPNVIGVRRREPRPGALHVVGTVAPGKTRRGPRSGDRRRDRAGEDRADRRLGDREGAQQRAQPAREQPRQLAERAITLGQDALFYDDPDRINTTRRPHREGDGGRRAARREAVSGEDRTHRRHHDAQGCAAPKGGL